MKQMSQQAKEAKQRRNVNERFAEESQHGSQRPDEEFEPEPQRFDGSQIRIQQSEAERRRTPQNHCNHRANRRGIKSEHAGRRSPQGHICPRSTPQQQAQRRDSVEYDFTSRRSSMGSTNYMDVDMDMEMLNEDEYR